MSTTIFHNPRCSKSRATLELLTKNQQEPEIIEYLKSPPSRD
ncbi:MAG: arsenate reductase (glutaredoxin), partial [Gammaproteobacteria bacterium]|nr:arsenate reductase (glutaredoxin) [Gammaproteobacteria bacterium]